MKGLPLNAVELERRDHRDGGEVVLAHLPDNKATPWVTWRVDAEGACHWGRYRNDKAVAERDFATR